jgi:uncharacterized protein (UPF0332 family)
MSVCSEDLIALATSLADQDSEARNRACVSRSYYALYHEALLAADALSLAIDHQVKTAHERLIRRYTDSSKGLAAIGKTMRKQKQLRAMADYEISADVTASEARFHLATSKRILVDLKRISASVAV